MGLCLDKARGILDIYTGTSHNVPRVLQPFIENMELIQTQIVAAVTDMKANAEHYAYESPGADGRGTWRQVLKLLLRIVAECTSQMSQLPNIPKHESVRHNVSRRYTQSHVLPVLEQFTEDLKVLVSIWPTLILVTMEPNALTEDEGKAILAAAYTHPFWYSVRPKGIPRLVAPLPAFFVIIFSEVSPDTFSAFFASKHIDSYCVDTTIPLLHLALCILASTTFSLWPLEAPQICVRLWRFLCPHFPAPTVTSS